MSEMIEEVAKAMWDARRAHANNSGVELEFWGDGSIPKLNGIMDEARAAIEAMQEPTVDMLTAAYHVVGVPERPVLANGYRAMIGYALK